MSEVVQESPPVCWSNYHSVNSINNGGCIVNAGAATVRSISRLGLRTWWAKLPLTLQESLGID